MVNELVPPGEHTEKGFNSPDYVVRGRLDRQRKIEKTVVKRRIILRLERILSKKITFGIVLPTRGVLFSGSDPRKDVIGLSKLTEEYGYDGVWAGDSILAKPRLDSISIFPRLPEQPRGSNWGLRVFQTFP